MTRHRAATSGREANARASAPSDERHKCGLPSSCRCRGVVFTGEQEPHVTTRRSPHDHSHRGPGPDRGRAAGQLGIKVGRIGQIYLDESTGELEWATVNTGHFGLNETFVPLAQADRAGNALRVPYEMATIKDAPNMFASGAHLDESMERELYVYYGLDYAASALTAGSPAVRRLPSCPEGARRQSAGRPATTPPAGTPRTR